LFPAIWENEKYRHEWKEGIIEKLPKKGNIKHCNKRRGITILSVFSKIILLITLKRIKSRIESKLNRHQAGFRAGHSCIMLISTFRIILEQYSE
jgi:hypothetical protein